MPTRERAVSHDRCEPGKPDTQHNAGLRFPEEPRLTIRLVHRPEEAVISWSGAEPDSRV
jgi:hypothetical protein